MKQLEDTNLAQVFDAPIDVILSEHDVLQPALAVVRASREHLITERGIEAEH